MLPSGRLRHRVTIERRVETQDDVTGNIVVSWCAFIQNIAAEIAPLSAREFIAAKATQSEIVGRITIRWRDGITAKMRVKRITDGRLYNIAGFLEDPVSGREWMTLAVTHGANDG